MVASTPRADIHPPTRYVGDPLISPLVQFVNASGEQLVVATGKLTDVGESRRLEADSVQFLDVKSSVFAVGLRVGDVVYVTATSDEGSEYAVVWDFLWSNADGYFLKAHPGLWSWKDCKFDEDGKQPVRIAYTTMWTLDHTIQYLKYFPSHILMTVRITSLRPQQAEKPVQSSNLFGFFKRR